MLHPTNDTGQEIEVEEATFGDEQVPKDGVILVFDGETFSYWSLGSPDDNTSTLTNALYRLTSYCNGQGEAVSRAVDRITGRIN
jgi:hypothetical protein